MKKIFALVLALALVLTAVSALAAGSKGGSDISDVTTDTPEVTVSKAADNAATSAIKKLISDGQAGGDALAELPEDVKAKIPADAKTVNEMETFVLSGTLTKGNSVVLTFKFATPYTEGEAVTILLGIPGETETEWVVLQGKGNKDGDVEVTVTKDILDKIGDKPFVVIPVSK